MKGKEGYDAITAMKGEGYVSNVSMADAFISLLSAQPELLNNRPVEQLHSHYE